MDLSSRINEALKFNEVFRLELFGKTIVINETIFISWIAMAFLIIAAVLITRRLKDVPTGIQAAIEAGVEFLNSFSKEQFGPRAGFYGPYVGSLFLFLIVVNLIPAITPFVVGLSGHLYTPPFEFKPPARDINFTASLAIITILMVIFGGLRARGIKGWLKTFVSPIPFMLPFNIMEYGIKPLSLCLRLFGNLLGSFIIMTLIQAVMPLILPPVASLYFDLFDGFIQALVFAFLTTLYVSEAIGVGE